MPLCNVLTSLAQMLHHVSAFSKASHNRVFFGTSGAKNAVMIGSRKREVSSLCSEDGFI